MAFYPPSNSSYTLANFLAGPSADSPATTTAEANFAGPQKEKTHQAASQSPPGRAEHPPPNSELNELTVLEPAFSDPSMAVLQTVLSDPEASTVVPFQTPVCKVASSADRQRSNVLDSLPPPPQPLSLPPPPASGKKMPQSLLLLTGQSWSGAGNNAAISGHTNGVGWMDSAGSADHEYGITAIG
ncbi:unnamed protein product, partial [Protopolystoma xenopodis]